MSTKVYTPMPPPEALYKEDPMANLTETEQSMYDEVLNKFSPEDFSLSDVEDGKLTEAEKFWLTRECLLRYLRASKWKVPVAIKRLETTLKWRREFGMYDADKAAYVEPEAVTGKELTFGFDVNGRPGLYMLPSRQNTEESPRQIQFAFWVIERAIDLMPAGVENLALLINYADKAKNPSMGTARTVLSILQEHYPERLGRAIVINIPFLINAFLKIIMPFVDPVTREKVKINPQVIKEGMFDKSMIMTEYWGGDQDFEYVHEKYWPALLKTCEDRRKAWMERWRELGAKVGVKEWDYKQEKGEKNAPAEETFEKPAETKKEEPAVAAQQEPVAEAKDTTKAPPAVQDTKDDSEATQDVPATAEPAAEAGAGAAE